MTECYNAEVLQTPIIVEYLEKRLDIVRPAIYTMTFLYFAFGSFFCMVSLIDPNDGDMIRLAGIVCLVFSAIFLTIEIIQMCV